LGEPDRGDELESTDAEDERIPAMLLAAALAAELAPMRGESTDMEEDSFLVLSGRGPASNFLVAPMIFSFSSGMYTEHQSGIIGCWV
jgi:hypothetical protein